MSALAPVVLDIAGTALSAADRQRLKHPLTGGLILFSRNWEDRRQLSALTAAAKKLRPDLLICVDHEGGRVQRFRGDGFTALPAMGRLGQAWRRDGSGGPGAGAMAAIAAATAVGHVLAAELRACGVDLSFTPVLDLDHGRSAVIGERAFDRDPRIVSLLAQGVMHGLLRCGMAHCGKHFPGHGHAVADSHVEVPVDRRSLKAILADDARPYAWLAGTLAAVMPAHVVYPKVDSLPAGASERWLKEILRGRLDFGGAVFSDDLDMEAARRRPGATLSHTEAAVQALNAGCDLVLLCNQSLQAGGAAIDELLHGLRAAAAARRWQPEAAAERRRLSLLPQTPPLPWDELMRDGNYRRALQRLP